MTNDERIAVNAALLRLFKNEYRESSDRHSDALIAREYVSAVEARNEVLESELRIVAAELTAVQQENLAEGVPPSLAINHRLNSVLRVLAGK